MTAALCLTIFAATATLVAAYDKHPIQSFVASMLWGATAVAVMLVETS